MRNNTYAATICLAALAAGACLGQQASAQLIFGEPQFVECTAAHYPTRARLFDMDGDGRLDLVLPGRDREKLLNWASIQPDGSFGPIQSMEVAGQTDDAVAADMNGDGVEELVLVIRSYAGKIQYLQRAANGRMQPGPLFAVGREPRSVTKGDFDGDGDIDLAVSCYGGEEITLLRNDGVGNLAAAQRVRVDPWAGGIPGPQDVMAADLNHDSRADLVVGCIGTRRFDILFGQAGGTFSKPISWLAPEPPGIVSPAVVSFDLADIDSDGDIDIVAPLLATSAGQPLVILKNDGTGKFPTWSLAGMVTGGYHWTALAADFDQDGKVDVVTATALSGNLFVWRNTTVGGAISFATPSHLDFTSFPRHLLAANLDGDCDRDLLVADIGGHFALGYPNSLICGQGTFAPVNQARGRERVDDAVTEKFERATPSVADATAGRFKGKLAFEIALELAAWGPDAGLLPVTHSFLVPPAACGPSGPGGRCDEVHATPGCFTTPCCEEVCGLQPDCCLIAWDQVCVDLAHTECNGLVCPSYGACTVIHADPGCEDPNCCERITPLDGYCGGATWDWVCVERAVQLCGLPPCTLTIPTNARPEGEVCYLHTNDGATRDGASTPLACGDLVAGGCTTGAPRDTDWYALGGSGSRRVRITLNAEFPAELHMMRGQISGPLELRSSNFGGRCNAIVEEVCIDSGPWYAVVSLGMDVGAVRGGQPCTEINPNNPPPPDSPPILPGFDGTRYTIQLECLNCASPGDLNGDGVVSGADLGILLGQFGASQPTAGDLNGDGQVTGADLGLLLGLWSAGS